MAGGQGAHLPELHQIFFGQIAVAEQMQQRIQKHGSMAAGKDETVPVGPLGIRRIVVHVMGPQLISHGRRSQRKAGMSGFGLLDRVRGKDADCVYG